MQAGVEIRYELMRIVQEALRNIADHARADLVVVRLSCASGSIALQVRDDGCGFVVPAHWPSLHSEGHFGVVGMAERAEAIGGTLLMSSSPGAGTSVDVAVPADRAASIRKVRR